MVKQMGENINSGIWMYGCSIFYSDLETFYKCEK